MKIHLAGRVNGHVDHVPLFEDQPEMRIHLAGRGDINRRETDEKMRIHLATPPFNNPQPQTAFRVGHPYYLTSYWYVRAGGSDRRQALGVPASNIIMDSGLFSLMFGSEKGTLPTTLEAYEQYTDQYLRDLEAWNYGGYFVEADVHKLLGMPAVHYLRTKFEKYGDRVIYVWHREEGIDGLLKLAEERTYIAISVPEIRSIVTGGSVQASSKVVQVRVFDLLRRIHDHCRKRGILPPRIHLLGCTVMSMMETTLAWSCDSTSWFAGIKYGRGFIWNPQGRFDQAAIRSRAFLEWRAECERMFPSSASYARSETTNPDYFLNVMACAAAMREYQTWLDHRYQHVPMRGDENQ